MSSDDFPTSKNPGKGKKGGDISEQLLKSLKPQVGKGTSNWLADLTQTALEEDSVEELEAAVEATAAPAPAQRAQIDLVPFVDKLFDMFTNYIYEFNKSVVGTNLTVNCERPVPTKEGDARFGSRGGPAFQGRLSMHSWSLIVRGEAGRVHCVALPSEQLFAFNADPNNDTYGRCLIIDSVDQFGQPGWNIAGAPLETDQLPTLAKQLLGRLVKVVKGEIDPLEEFAWTGSMQSSAKISNTGAPLDTSGQFSRTVRGLDVNQPVPARPKSFDEDADPLFTAINHKYYTPDASEFALEPERPKATDEKPKAAPPAPSAPATISDAFAAMETAIDAELDRLSKAGAKAFEAKDLTGAEQSLKKTSTVKQFRDRIQALKSDWEKEQAAE